MLRADHPLRILIVDDDAVERERCRRFLLADPKVKYVVREARSAAEARAAIAAEPPDCVLLDHPLPDADGVSFVSELADAVGEAALPFVVMTQESDAELAVAALKAGAQDYAVKSRLTPEGLTRSVRHAVEKMALRHELERKQRALNESQRRELEMKEELLSHVSHELRTPLTAVHQFVSILLDEVSGELNPKQKEFLSIVYKNAKQLRDMIADLMDVARGGAGKLGVDPCIVSLKPILEDCVASLAESAAEKQLTLQLQPVPALPRVLADANRVRQIVCNLVTNAIKFSPEGTRICVRAALQEPDGQEPDGQEHEPRFVQVSVTDQGCGIARESFERIFERMYQEPSPTHASRRGLGLGLYICRQLVEGHGGDIWVESERGAGSTFHFSLPAHSLSRLLRPLLLLEEEPEDGCHLMAIELRLSEDIGADQVDAAFGALRREVECLVHRDRDIVVPRLGTDTEPEDRRELCFVVAHVDQAAARAMSSRLLRALRRSAAAASLDVEVTIRMHSVDLPPRHAPSSAGWLERVALGVRRAIDAELGGSGFGAP